MPADPRAVPPFYLPPPPSPPSKPSFLRRLFGSSEPEPEQPWSAYYARAPSPSPSARSTDAGPSNIHPAWAYYAAQAEAIGHRPLPSGDDLPKGLPGRMPKSALKREPSYALRRTSMTEPDPYIMNALPTPRPPNYHKLSSAERKHIDWVHKHEAKRIAFEKDQELQRAKRAKKVAAEQEKAAKKLEAAARAKAAKADAERKKNYE